MRSPPSAPTTRGTATTPTACSATPSSRSVAWQPAVQLVLLLVACVPPTPRHWVPPGGPAARGSSAAGPGAAAVPPAAGRPSPCVPPSALRPSMAAGHPEAGPGQPSGAVPGQPGGAGHRHARARHPLCGGQLGEPRAGRLGPRLGGARGWPGGWGRRRCGWAGCRGPGCSAPCAAASAAPLREGSRAAAPASSARPCIHLLAVLAGRRAGHAARSKQAHRRQRPAPFLLLLLFLPPRRSGWTAWRSRSSRTSSRRAARRWRCPAWRSRTAWSASSWRCR